MSDVLIVGGGIIGLLTARELAATGAAVTVLEQGEAGRESSWAGGGLISPLYPWRYADSVTALVRWSQRIYPRLCVELAAESGIDPELTANGLLILDADEHPQALAWAARHGTEARVIAGSRLREEVPELAPRPAEALLLPAVANVRNPRLLAAARRALAGRIRLCEEEEVVEVQVANGRVRGLCTTRGTHAAERVVVCAGAWTGQLLERLGPQPDIEPVRGQMLLFAARPGLVRYSTLWRDRYLIPRRDGRVLAGSTQERVGFDKTATPEARAVLYEGALELYPLLAEAPIEAHWAGLRPGAPAPRAASPTSAPTRASTGSTSTPATSGTASPPAPPPPACWPTSCSGATPSPTRPPMPSTQSAEPPAPSPAPPIETERGIPYTPPSGAPM